MIHVAVLLRPYLDMILRGEKTVECRLTQQARDPYERIEPGERIYFKQSAGPYAATALVEHALFEGDLSPRRVSEIRRDYNHLIGGDAAFWRGKRSARHCSLIWLRDVQATASGPRIRPLQGVAWLCLEEEPAWRRVDDDDNRSGGASAAEGAFAITITPGNLKNHTLYVTAVRHRFPEWTMGGTSRREAAKPITLMLHQGPTVQTDIVARRNLLRTRVWGPWFRQHGARPNDRVIFTPVDDATYFVGLARIAP